MSRLPKRTLTYAELPAIVDDLLAQGLHPSVEKVRERLGHQGSFQTIAALVRERLRELGRLPQAAVATSSVPTVPIPTADPAAVAGVLHRLRWDTQMARAEALAERYMGGTNGTREPTDRQA